jgi:hypothetical protein
MNNNWRNMITQALPKGENIIACTISDEELDRKFYDGYGSIDGTPFTAWSENWVYFPLCYDGSESVGSAPRNPCDRSMEHQGG